MREITGAELDAISGGTDIGFCRQLSRWEWAKVEYVRLFFGDAVAADLARSYSYS